MSYFEHHIFIIVCLILSIIFCVSYNAVLLLQKMPSIQRSEVTNELLVTIGNIADTKVDYRYDTGFMLCLYISLGIMHLQ